MQRNLAAILMFIGGVFLIASLMTASFGRSDIYMRVGSVLFLVGGFWIAMIWGGSKRSPVREVENDILPKIESARQEVIDFHLRAEDRAYYLTRLDTLADQGETSEDVLRLVAEAGRVATKHPLGMNV